MVNGAADIGAVVRRFAAVRAGGSGERGREVSLAGAGVADEQDVFAFVDELGAAEFGDHHLVDRRPCDEVKRVERLDRWEPRRLDPAFDRAFLALQQFEFGRRRWSHFDRCLHPGQRLGSRRALGVLLHG